MGKVKIKWTAAAAVKENILLHFAELKKEKRTAFKNCQWATQHKGQSSSSPFFSSSWTGEQVAQVSFQVFGGKFEIVAAAVAVPIWKLSGTPKWTRSLYAQMSEKKRKSKSRRTMAVVAASSDAEKV